MVTFDRVDLEFVLQQILMAEAGQPPVNPHLAFGLREVAGTNNNSVPGNETFGSADQVFPRVTTPVFRTVTVNIDGTIFDPNPGVAGDTMTTTYADTSATGLVVDTAPRTISNLIVDQTANNPAAVEAQAGAMPGDGYLYQGTTLVPNPAFNPDLPEDLTNLRFLPSNVAIQPAVDASGNLFIPNVTPDAGLSAPFNQWFTFFGQFFDHGLDLVTKGGSGTIFIPLQPDDPLITVGPDGISGTGDEITDPALQFMVLTRATNLPGPDGIVGTADDIHENTNTTTPFVDQNQTYSSHPSHQVFLRDYMIGADGHLHSTGKLLTGTDGHSMATWADVKANALKLGLLLHDEDVNNVPLLATDAFGNLIAGPNGFAQVVVRTSNGADGIAGTSDDVTILVEGTAAGLDLSDHAALGGTAVRTGHAFLNDIAHGAAPSDPDAPGPHLVADADTVAGGPPPAAGFYDNELLDAHYIAGDGRANENIALTAIHDIFHAEHNRQIEVVKAQIQAELDKGDTSFAGNWVLPGVDLTVANGVDAAGNPVHIIQADEWNGERLFQVAKFSTEVQYQHLVFEEFARKVSPNIHLFGNNDIHLDPAITSEFANVVYRFGHSMLDENVNRYVIGPDGTPLLDPVTGQPVLNQIGLIDAFLNPLAFAASGATATGEIVLGAVNQVGNEIDEFVTGALRNNLLGLPLDLAAINLARGRDTGVAPLNLVRNQIYTELNTGGTNDTTLKPYASWDEFGQFLKHAGSLVNFVAAYGTHASIIGATTLLDKRAAALALVENAVLGSATFSQDAYDFMHSLGAYANDIDNPLAVHAEWSTGSVTGLDTVDLWIGGLAEKQNLFGGLLGSTFNFIFENQMEAIQDADRLYYLPRIEGLHFGTEIENNTFADLIMRNTGTHHLSANIFMTPEYVVEAGTVDPNDPSTWLRNSVTGALLVEVLTDDYVDGLFGDGQHHVFDTQVHFLGDDNFFGNTIVLGGTEGRDVLISGQADDDTVYGDGGDDFLDGGNGNDMLFGGSGNDVIRDSAGDDIIHGGSGNDDIDGGLGLDVIFGEDGDDLLHGGNSTDFGDEISGGTGNDIIFGDEGDDELIGNEGDDWIEGGDGGDALVGDIGAPTGQVPLYSGNDVLDGGTQGDKMVGFSGDDIMLGLGGFDKFTGLLGFDWGSFENETHGVSVDMTKREFIPNQLAPAGDAVRDFWIETEAVSGSAFDDVLGGTNVGQAQPGAAPFVDTFNELVNVNLIFGLAGFFPEGPVAFSDGNIMLGGGGNDFIEGRGGNDIIDGDAYLHVELTRDANGNIFPGSQIVREILFDTTPGNIDTAVFTGNLADYTINFTPDAQGFITVTDNVGTDGTDRLRNIERLQFGDVTIGTTNSVPTGTVVVNGTAQVGQVLTADATAVADADGIVSPFSFQWQYQILAAPGGTSQWVDIVGATDATFAPTDFYVGNALRVVTSFVDGQGFTERLFSAPTALLVTDPAVNHAPTVVTQVAENGLFDTSARQDTPLTLFLPLVTTFTDDQTNAANLIYTATLADGSALSTVGLTFTTTPDGAGGVTGGVITGTPPAGFIGTIDIRVKATDAGGLSVTDTFTINVLPSDGISTGAAALPAPLATEPQHIGVQFDRTDLEFVLQQILMAEAGQPPVNPHLAFGLREVAGTNNNSVPGNETFGSADQVFPRVTTPVFRTVTVNIDGTIFDPNPGVAGDTMTTTYADTSATGLVVDTAPRTISNLIVDQTANNPAAVEAQAGAMPGDGYLYQGTTLVPNPAFNPDLPEDLTNLRFLPSNVAIQPAVDASGNLFIPNVTPDAGLSAPFNQWFTFFGQFFDHGLDLVTKGGSGTIFIPLQPDDPLITVGPDGISGTGDEITDPALQFMVLTRATNLPGPDGIVGTADDIHENTNTTTPFVDQNQTYSSHPSHQVFLRDYMIGADGHLHSTGKLLTGTDGHSMATWADVKANALKLGLLLHDEDVNNVPLLATDAFGNLIAGPNGFAQVVVRTSNGADGIAGTSDDVTILVEGTAAGLDLSDHAALGGTAVRTGHAFLNDIAHGAAPSDPDAPGPHLVADADTVAGGPPPAAGFYDNELLDAHYIAGDGRANENIALTAIHDIFHAEHNRQIEVVKAQIQAELDKGDTSFAGNWVLPGVDLTVANGVDAAGNPVHIIQADEWNGERLFQVAKFSTEVQYQHLVFEEFARKVSPNIHLFGNNDIHLDPAITSEFANVVYRFGHSMLDENVNRYVIGPDGTPLLDPVTGQPVLNQIGLIDAFLNPLAFAASGATATGEIVLGAVNQVGNEIDEFVTGALRNNLLGLPLDLAAINLARGRDTGVAPLNLVRNQIYTELNTGGTNDTTLKPYASWDEFGQFLKHAGSLVNFVAAYGTHASIIGATTLLDKRAAALALVENAVLGSATFSQDAYDFMHSLGAYANDIDNPLAVHAEWSTGSVTGLDTVDLWIGGLAEKQNLFGGLLGSTFNFIFENQMEAIQDADRLYYLPRIEGLHFGTEIENNTFADLIMRNTGTHHLSANIFMTPEYVVEAGTVDPNDPSTWLRNSVTGALLVEVLTDDYVDGLFGDGQHHVFDTQVHFLGDDNFFGNTIVLGGTEGRDVLISGQADDDTVYGDGGDDFLDGGNGNDMLFGGSGNDVIRDSAGDDIIHGGSGNDDIDGGLGLDVIFGEDGDDLLHGGNSTDFGDEISGGTGNDIIFGDEGDDELIGNEGDDWIEGGDGGDALVGDIGAPTGQVPLYSGNDVLDGGTQGDKMVGFSGDDIMLGLGGFDKFTGLLGFDWGSFENETHGVSVDMTKREFIPNQLAPAGDAVRDFWIETEAVSGSAFDDVLGGTNVGQAQPGAAPFVDTFNELVNVDLITGLDRYFPGAGTGTPVAFSDGNIMLGGGGNDFIEGRGGNDIIDGDARLHVELTRDANGNIFPGSQIIREILTDQAQGPTFDPLTGAVLTAGDIDTAVYADVSANYQISLAVDADGNILFGTDGNPVLTVTHVTPTAGAVFEGTDILHNIERLQFADVTIDNPFALVTDFAAQGALTIDNAAPAVGDVLSVTSTINDFEGVLVNGVLDAATAGFERIDIPLNELSFQWQYEIAAAPGGTSQWVDIVGATDATFAPTDFYVGNALRVVASFVDGLGVTERVISAPTALLVTDPAVNHAPTVVTQVAENGLFDTSARQDTPLTLFLPLVTTFTDDQTNAANLIYTATLADGSALSTVGLTFTTTPDGAGGVTGGVITGTPPAGFIGTIDIRVKATDAGGLSVTDTFTINVLPDRNHAPVITSGNGDTAAVSVEENSAAVTTVTAADPDAGAALTFSIAAGADAALFTIDPITGAVSFITPPDFEAPSDADGDNVYEVIVQVSDGKLTDSQAITVTVTNVNEAPTITSNGGGAAAAVSIAENTTAVTTVTATDPDGASTLTFSIAGGADAARFAIDATTGALSFVTAPDFEVPTDAGGDSIYGVVVQVSDGSLIDTQAIAIAVTNVAGVTLTGTGGANALSGTGEEDTLSGLGGNDVLNGLGGNDILDGGAGADVITGGAGNDVIIGGAGNDILDAGAGNDVIVYAFGDGVDSIDGGAGFDTLNITGTAGNNVLNVIFDGTSITTLEGGMIAGVEAVNADLLGGTDTLNYAGTTAAVTVNLATGSASGFNSVAGIENVTGGSGNDTLIGNASANTLAGGAGDDTYFVGTGDVVTEAAGAGSDSVFTDGAAFTLGANVENLTFTGTGSFSGTGNALDNIITGGAASDTLSGGGGADTLIGGDSVDSLNGGAGNDILIGGAGNDVMNGGADNDTFVFAAGFGNDVITGFDANPTGGQDLLDISGLGITAATFATDVIITDLGSDTLVSIGTDSMLLVGVNGVGANAITQQDFILH